MNGYYSDLYPTSVGLAWGATTAGEEMNGYYSDLYPTSVGLASGTTAGEEMHGYYSDLYPTSVGLAWGTTTAGEEMKKSLVREGVALFMSLRDQIMEPAPMEYQQMLPGKPNPHRLVMRPSVSSAVRTWWQTTAAPLFSYFGNWIKHGPSENLMAWTIRLAELRREAARLGLLVLPSTYLEAFGAAPTVAVGQTIWGQPLPSPPPPPSVPWTLRSENGIYFFLTGAAACSRRTRWQDLYGCNYGGYTYRRFVKSRISQGDKVKVEEAVGWQKFDDNMLFIAANLELNHVYFALAVPHGTSQSPTGESAHFWKWKDNAWSYLGELPASD